LAVLRSFGNSVPVILLEDFLNLAGSEQGARLSLVLALISAMAHAVFAALNKGGFDPYLNRGAINFFYSLFAAPFALLVLPLPESHVWPVLALSFFLHLGYELFQAAAYARGAFTITYPVGRGTAPVVVAVIAYFLFAEKLGVIQWLGIMILSSAIISLAIVDLRSKDLSREARAGLGLSIVLAIIAGLFIASYTLADAYGIRLTANPFTFLAWFFFLGGFGFPPIAYVRWLSMGVSSRPPLRPLILKGIIGAIVAFFSFGMLLLATRIGKVGEAAAIRETSVVFATFIGVFFFKERVGHWKWAAIAAIAVGAGLLEVH